MAIVFDPTLGSKTQNALISVEEADDLAGVTPAGADWLGISDADDKRAAIIEATSVFETLRMVGYRLWPEHQRLKWPRIRRRRPDFRFEVQGFRPSDETFRVLHPRITSFQQSGPDSSTEVSSAALAGVENEPDDFWIGGSVRVRSGPLINVTKRVTDFVSSTGVITCEDFGGNITSAIDLVVIEGLHHTVKKVIFEFARMVAREGAGWVDRKEDQDPFVLMSGLVDRLSRGIRAVRANVT